MPVDVQLDMIPVGYALDYAKPESMVSVATKEFCSSEDGDHFVSRLEGLPSVLLAAAQRKGAKATESSVDHLLALVWRDKRARIFINELDTVAQVRSKRDVQAGAVIQINDVADIAAIKFRNVQIPADTGVVYLFSIGWRKGLFFDLSPIQTDPPTPRTENLEQVLARYYSYMWFQSYFRIEDAVWKSFFDEGWFPFISLKKDTVDSLINHAKAGWNLDKLVPQVIAEIKEALPRWLTKWKSIKCFADHLPLLTAAAERFAAEDFVSAISILYPRIEGVMRSYHIGIQAQEKMSQEGLVRSLLSSISPESNPKLLLFPEKFRTYLKEVFFAHFDPQSPSGLSRHTFAHGVAAPNTFDKKAAAIGFLLLDQLSFYVK